jgi:iron complex outermembrane receptor protein
MSTSISIRRAVRYALLAGAAAVATNAAPVMAAEDTNIMEVVVTGSRITTNRDAIAESPIVTFDIAALEDSGYVSVDHFMNTLPQIVPALSSQSNNPSSNGRAFLDLRGLGNNRNLVLIDGRRGMGSTSGGVVDINTIPAALIERVELITGGAAAAYGPDAVAGVVNFILKKDFDGFAVGGRYGLTEENDGQEWSTDLTFGGKFADDRGRAIFNVSYFNREDMYKDARSFAGQASSTTGTFPGGSWAPGTNAPSAASVASLFGANQCNANGGSAGFGFNPDGTLFCTGVAGSPRDAVGFTGPDSWIATQFYPDVFSYNFEPDNILVLPMERWSLYTHLDVDVAPRFQPYVQAMYTNYNALQELAPTPATGFTVPVSNPFIPAQMVPLLQSRTTPGADFVFNKRFNDLGGRTGYNNHDVWQVLTGTKGEIVGSWRYDLYASYGRSVQTEIQGGNVRLPRVEQLLDAADGGASLCAGGLNLFGSAPISQACKDFISLEAKNLTVAEQNVIEGVANGEVFELPAGPVLMAVGASYRDLKFDFKPDSGLQPGQVAGFNEQLPITGQLDYTDVFTEVNVPVLRDLPGIKSLGTSAAYRSTDNNIFGEDQTWKLALDWAINDWARFRGSKQFAVRSPNIAELYQPQVNNFPTFTSQDPCNTTGTIAATYRNGPNAAQVQALCAAQAAVAGGATYVQPAGQARGLTGGNPNLQPEKADSYNFGFVLSSPFDSALLERASVSIDYWSIELEDRIQSIEAPTIVQRCFNREGSNPTYDVNNAWCQMFVRDQANGGVIDLQQLQQNQAFVNTSGIDLTIDWGFGLGGLGDMNLRLITTWLEKFEEQTAVTPNDSNYDYLGTIGSTTGTSNPEWKGTLVTTYSFQDLQATLTTRYIDSMINRNVVTGGAPASNTGVNATWYLDLTTRYDLTRNASIGFGVNNLTNQPPRLYTPNVQANTDPSLYDVLGRRYYIRFDVRM